MAWRWGLLGLCATALLAALGAWTSAWQPSALRLAVTAAVGLLAPLFWPGLAATAARSALRVIVWSAGAGALAAALLLLAGAAPQPAWQVLQSSAMLTLILLAVHAAVAWLEGGLRGPLGGADAARATAGRIGALALALAGALPLWLGPAAEIAAQGRQTLVDAAVGLSPLTHLAVASGNDLLRNQWFYQHSNLATLPFAYPGVATLAAAYGAAIALLALGALRLRPARRGAAPIAPFIPQEKPE